jgi:hypothetical protein
LVDDRLWHEAADRCGAKVRTQRTAQDWLENYDANADAILAVLDRVYGPAARLWQRRWRLFFLATMGHYRR